VHLVGLIIKKHFYKVTGITLYWHPKIINALSLTDFVTVCIFRPYQYEIWVKKSWIEEEGKIENIA